MHLELRILHINKSINYTFNFLFQNSPLYQYLQDVGHTDFEVCSPLVQKPEECTFEEGQKDMATVAIQNVSTQFGNSTAT